MFELPQPVEVAFTAAWQPFSWLGPYAPLVMLAIGGFVIARIVRRRGKAEIEPGYDGKYGKIKILDKNEIRLSSGQLCLFPQEKEKDPTILTVASGQKEPAEAIGSVAAVGAKESIQSAETILSTKPIGANETVDGEGPVESLFDAAVSSVELVASTKDTGTEEVITKSKTSKTSPGDIPYGLNPEQWEAVSASEPAIVVSAGPGTGKTKTLVSRIAWLVQKCGVHPSRITAVTFTNKAAGEMRGRLEKHFGNRHAVKAMTIGTFHSICLQILSAQNGAERVTIIDEPDALSALEEILKRLGLKNSPRDVLHGISLIKNGAPAVGKTSGVPEEVYDLYCRQLEQYGVLDYDDILLNVLRKFENGDTGDIDEMKGNRLLNSFSYLLVDEFQDINDVQYRLIREWSKNSKSIFVIGDPDQSIYGFRGSDSRYFDQFPEDFSPVRKIRLSANYRSTPEIIRCAGSVISKGTSGTQPRFLEAKRKSGVKVRLLNAADALSESISVAKEINRLVGGVDMLDASSYRKGSAAGQQWGFSDIAVLYRTNRQAEMLEQCLLKEGIPYTVAGRDESLSAQEIRKTIAFFRFLLNSGDLISLKTCLKTFGGVPTDLLPKLLERYAAVPKGLSSLADIFQMPEPAEASGSLPTLLKLFGKYEPLVHQEKPLKLIESFLNDNALSDNKSDNKYMELLLHTAVMYGDLESLLQGLVLGNEQDVVRSGGKSYSPNAVSLMTLHAAKGLEFPVVFLCGLNEGMIPYQNRLGSSDPEEERRLFYVGITRARDELVLLTSGTPSPFLADLSEDSLTQGDAFSRRQMPGFQQLSLFDK